MEVNEKNFLYSINKIRQKLFRFLKSELDEKRIDGVAPSYGDILFVLDQKGPLTVQELARHTLKDKSTVSSVISRLEAQGYIVKEKDGGDARFTKLTLTAKAMKLRPALFEISDKMNARLFDGLSKEEKVLLFKLIEKIQRNL